MKRLIVGLVVMVFLTIDVFAASRVIDKTLAIVNGEPIFMSEFNSIFLPTLEQYKQNTPIKNQTEQKENELKNIILNQYIEEVLLSQEAKKQKIQVLENELQDVINDIKKRFANESEFIAELKKENITIMELEKNINNQIAIINLLRQTVESKIKIPTENEAKVIYDKIIAKIKENKTESTLEDDPVIISLVDIVKRISKEQVKLRQILVICPQSATADKVKIAQDKIAIIKKELQKQSFENVAAQYSEDTASKSRNGDLGVFANGDLVPAINKVAFSMEVGNYTREPIKTDIGYYFIKIDEKRAKRDISFNEVKDAIIRVLYHNNARQIHADYVNKLKLKSNIKINKTW